MRHIGTEVGRRCVDLQPSSRATWRWQPAARWSSAPSPSTTMAAVIDDTSCTSCTCCCALSHGSTWQLPNRPYLRSSVLDAVVAHTRPSARRPARRYSAYGELGGRQRDDVASVERSDRAASSAAPSSSAGSMWMLRGRQILEPPHSLKSTTRSECSRASAHGRSGGGVCVEDRERVEQRLPTLDRQAGNGRRQRVFLRRRLGRHARYDVAQRTRLRGVRRLRATR